MRSNRVHDKVALITGAGSGIGRSTAILMAQEGATTIVADIDFAAARSVVGEIGHLGGEAHPIQLDVTIESAWQAATEEILATHQRLDILVNNAGISISKPVAACTYDEWRQVLATNLDGAFLGTKQAIAAMKYGGSIINVASVSGMTPSAGAAAYCTSKAAIRMFSKVAAIECLDARTEIRVNLVTPGGVKTPMWEREEFFQTLAGQEGGTEQAFAAMAGEKRSHQFMEPSEVAETILYLASDESSHLTGTEIVLDRGHSIS